MEQTEREFLCKYCKLPGQGKYCSHCGQEYKPHRITLHSILHEVFHFFTHLDKGFPYTLKRLITAPGIMQYEYLEGKRNNYQKPFSQFFICATIAALVVYWVNMALMKYYHAGNSMEAAFFNKYWVLLQVVMLPIYALITWLFFKGSGYNYAESGVFQLYIFSVLFLMIAFIHLLKFAWPNLQTRYIELPLIIIYTIISNINFYRRLPAWQAVTRGILAIGVSFFIASYIQDKLIPIFAR